jgi:hypothetical protein
MIGRRHRAAMAQHRPAEEGRRADQRADGEANDPRNDGYSFHRA